MISGFLKYLSEKVGGEGEEIRQIVRAATGNFFVNILGSLISLFSNMLLAKYFGASVLGVVALIGAVASLASLVSNFGLSGAIVRLIPEYRVKGGVNAAYAVYRRTFTLRLLFMILTVLIYYSLVNTLEKYLFSGVPFPIHTLLLWVGILVFGGSLYGFFLQTIRALKQIFAYNLLEITPRLVFLLALLLVLLTDYRPIDGVYAKVAGEVVTLFLSGIVMMFVWKKVAPFEQADTDLSSGKILKIALPFFAASALNIVMTQADVLMLGVLTGAEEVGVYQMAGKLTLLLSFIVQGVALVAGPMIAELYYQGRKEKLRKLMRDLVSLLLLAMLPSLVLLIFLGKTILGFFGTDFSGGYWTLVVLSFSAVSTAFFGLSGLLLSMTGYQGTMSRFAFYAMLLNLGSNLLLIPPLGALGAAIATLVSTVFWNLLAIVFIYKKFGYSISIIR